MTTTLDRSVPLAIRKAAHLLTGDRVNRYVHADSADRHAVEPPERTPLWARGELPWTHPLAL